MQENEGKPLLRLFPLPGERVPLDGLYLSERFGPPGRRSKSFVYTNFIASLDGRISLPDSRTLKRIVPPAIANARDWRLFQELAACADALVVSGRYVRDLPQGASARSFPVSTKPEHADLLAWRSVRGLPPQPAVVVVSASLDLPPLNALAESGRSVYIATGSAADADKVTHLESQGVRVLAAGSGMRVEGARLIEALAGEGHSNIAMISGGQVLEALIADDALDRLYLTLACRMLGGLSFDTLFTGPALATAARFTLDALHYDAASADGSDVEQLFAVFDRYPRWEARTRTTRDERA
jgi:riboflavin biosynthesis pyrimidine reductase